MSGSGALATLPLLRIPPFPGFKGRPLALASEGPEALSGVALEEIARSIKNLRIAGTYWARQPVLPEAPYILVRTRDEALAARFIGSQPVSFPIVSWAFSDRTAPLQVSRTYRIFGECDPWHLLEGAVEVIADADDELAVIAAIAGIPVRCVGEGPFQTLSKDRAGLFEVLRGPLLAACAYTCPFSGRQITPKEAVDLCSDWRRLIDRNRTIKAAMGFASWKRSTVAPLLWAGSSDVQFVSSGSTVSRDDEVAIWKSRVPSRRLAELARKGAHLIEVEDGFIRSVGLGADCVPPLSIIVDSLGVYFDPAKRSDLELLLEEGDFSPAMIERARRLRELIVESGISKYEVGRQKVEVRDIDRRHLLVVGQVEDDRSVVCGGGSVRSNLELLRRVRQKSPDAFISYRPHPDVQAGHRQGRVSSEQLAQFADEESSIGSASEAMEAADEVHVNTSLAGFEALLRGKPVTTYGVPFYAGWGLTTDLGEVPSRRTAKRSLDELVAATLLLYPRYLDPVTGLPCPAEVLALRLAENHQLQAKGLLVRLRQMQGRWKRRLLELRMRVSK